MKPTKHSAVLFADITDSVRLYETAGDSSASTAIRLCLQMLREATASTGGRVVKTIGDELMATFPTPDATAVAAARMQAAIQKLPPVGERKLTLRIGFHAGPVIHRDEDIFGDTVNLASRLVGQAVAGKILTSDETAAKLTRTVRNWTRPLYPVHIKGKSEQVALCEVVWGQSPDLTDIAKAAAATTSSAAQLRLRYCDVSLASMPVADVITIGREKDCALVVVDSRASRRHCTIERRGDQFVLIDHSANGTFVTVEGEEEIVLMREEVALRKHGSIALGGPRSDAVDIVEYACEQVD